jgi:hypothetical protein
LVDKANRVTASEFLTALIAAVPYKIHIVLTDNGIQFRLPPRYPVFADSTPKNPALIRMRFDRHMEFHDYIGPARPKTAVVKTYPVPPV